MGYGLNEMQIEVYTTNGEVIKFSQDDPSRIREILDEVNKERIFNQSALTVRSTSCVSTFLTRNIEMLKFHYSEEAGHQLPFGLEELQEVTREEFEDRYMRLPIEEKIALRCVERGQLIQGFIEIHLRSGNMLLLDLHLHKKTRADAMRVYNHAFQLPFLPFHLSGGSGFGALNTENVTRFTGHPGPDRVPASAWHAEADACRLVVRTGGLADPVTE